MVINRVRVGVLGALAGGSLMINIPWSRLVLRSGGWIPSTDVWYLDDLVVALISIFSGTIAGPIVGTGLTFVLVLGIMYQALSYFQIREIAPLYSTTQFRLLLTTVAAGFGLGWILFFGELDSFIQITDVVIVVLIASWTFGGLFAFGVFLSHSADPTSPENPVVGLLAHITGAEQSAYRRTQVTQSWAPTWVSGPVNIIAAGFVLTIVTFILGLMVALITRTYPLPEIVVLSWILSQLIGVHRFPYLGWLENIEIERQVYEKLGSGTVTFYGLMVALAYIVILGVGTGMFAVVGVPVLVTGLEFFGEHVAGSDLVSLLTSFEQMTLLALVLAYTLSPAITGIHWISYWVLAILRLPAVVAVFLPDQDADIQPSYRRLEGLTLPGSVLLVWTVLYARFEVYAQSQVVQYVFILTFIVAFVANGWTLYRAIWAGLAPQSAHAEERIIRLAVTVQAISLVITFTVAGVASNVAILTMGFLLVGFVVLCQYLPRIMHTTAVDEKIPARFNILLSSSCLVLIPVSHLRMPEFSPVLQILLIVLAGVVIVTSIMGRRGR